MRIAILLSMFPEAHETFILRELVELERQGLDIQILSLQYPRDSEHHPDAVRLMEKAWYGSLWGGAALAAFCRTALRHPLRLARFLLALIAAGWREPAELLKSLSILPLALHFGERMKENGIRHIHTHWHNVPATAGWLLHRACGFSWSAAIHGENIFTGSRLLRAKLSDTAFIAVCTGYSWRYLREEMGLPRPEAIHLNYHGLEPAVWDAARNTTKAPIPADAPVLLTCGRLVTFKGHDVLLRALARLRARGLHASLRLVGAGPEEERLRALAEELGVADAVTWLGQIPFARILDEMQSADLFVLACRRTPDGKMDGIPNVLAEAMALGTPVVSTTVSGIPELVEDGVSGRLTPPEDPDRLAEAIREILNDPALAQALSEGGREKVRGMFDLPANVRELKALFERYVPADRRGEQP